MQPRISTRFFRAVGRVVTSLARRVTGRKPYLTPKPPGCPLLIPRSSSRRVTS
jgi:hypothetical protein